MSSKTWLMAAAFGLGVAASAGAPAVAQEWPTRTVKFLVPYGPGGGTDIVSRIIAQELQTKLGQNFVVENKGNAGLESLKLDLVVFGTDGSITRRLITEMGPIRAMKTSVRAFLVDIDCKSMGAILVNDVTACTPGNPPACLDALGLSSRVKEIRLYK